MQREKGHSLPKDSPGIPLQHYMLARAFLNWRGCGLWLMAAKFEIENERSKKDTGWKELIQTRNILPAIRIECSESMLSRFISGKTDKLDDESKPVLRTPV